MIIVIIISIMVLSVLGIGVLLSMIGSTDYGDEWED